MIILKHITLHTLDISSHVGQQQRVAIARALASSAPFILADEPTGNLDEDTAKEIVELLRQTAKTGKCVVIVTHSAEIAKQVDYALQLHMGLLREYNPAE